MWQGVNAHPGTVASAIWVNRAGWPPQAIGFIDIDGTSFVSSSPSGALQRALPVTPAPRKAGLLGLAVTFLLAASAQAAPIAVRYQEGVVRAFPVLRSIENETLAHSDFVQVARGDQVVTRLVFRFKDGSLHDETVVFSQRCLFTLLSYRLVLQIDVAVKDSRASGTTGWVFGTFNYNSAASGARPWDKMVPVGLMWGNDPLLTPAKPVQYLYIVTRGIALRQLQRRDRFVLVPADVLVARDARRQQNERGRQVVALK